MVYHGGLAETGIDAFGQPFWRPFDVMTPERLAELGFPLETLIATINATALIERDRAIVAKSAAEAERDQAIAERDALRTDLAAKTELTAKDRGV